MKKIKLYLNNAGYCVAKKSHSIKGAEKKPIHFNALFGLIEHPEKGWILYDTGYADRFFEATRSYPHKIYANITKVVLKPEEEVQAQLMAFGIEPEDIQHIILTHFHADHVAGLKDFKNATIYCSKKAFLHAKNSSHFWGFSKGILKDLMPADIENRVQFVEEIGTTQTDDIFGERIDLFNDDSILVYYLPGHAVGQIGILLETTKQQYFLIADACWNQVAYKDLKLPHPIVRTFFSSWKSYKDIVQKLHEYHKKHPEVTIIPTHCNETTDQLINSKIDMDAL